MARIAVVEDDPDVRMVNVLILRRAGDHQITEFGNGLDALHAVRAGGPDRPELVLTDHLMPRMTGEELCCELRSDPSTAAIPVVMISGSLELTGYPDIPGVVRYLSKPVRPDELIGAVNAALSGSPEVVPEAR
jgi:CheY-like chemotaxis protein